MKFKAFYKILAIVPALLSWSVGLWADNPDPFPKVNPYAYYGNMSVTVKVKRGSEALQNVVVAVYSGNEIRGKASPSDSNKPGVIYMTVYGNKKGEKLSFKVFDKSTGFTYEKNYGQKYKHNGKIGSPLSPYELILDDSGRTIILTESTGVTNLTEAGDVSFERTFTEGKASTICLPFAMTNVKGGKFYTFSGIELDKDKKEWVATMTDATPDGNSTTSTVANTPYLFLPDASGTVTFSGTVSDVSANIEAGTTTNGDWTFHGTYSNLTYGTAPLTGTVYGFAATDGTSIDGKTDVAAGQFVRAGAGAYMAPFRAYLTYNGSNQALQAPARNGVVTSQIPNRITVRLVSKSGTVTGVGSLDVSTGDVVIERWFDMSGRPVEGQPSAPGIYFNNSGKKIIIR